MRSCAFGVVSCRIRLNCVGILDVLNYDADTVVQQYQVLSCSLVQNCSHYIINRGCCCVVNGISLSLVVLLINF